MKWCNDDIKNILKAVANEEKKDVIMIEKDFLQ